MRYRYHICDVFTDVRFGGNQLAVLPEAEGLSDRQMQKNAMASSSERGSAAAVFRSPKASSKSTSGPEEGALASVLAGRPGDAH
jgi:predicted PhzF superfamily epimerase YddE/YHI9